jgi:FAD/FMN-containing dehydrogenase
MNRLAIDLVLTQIPGTREPIGGTYKWYVLLELGSAESDSQAGAQLEQFLAASMERGQVLDGVLAQSSTQRDAFWRIRHSISEAQKLAGAGIKHDVSVPVSRVAALLDKAERYVVERVPGVQVVAFGHLGDGNMHFNLNQPPEMPADEFLGLWDEISHEVHTIVAELDGSFSAEHGVGSLKTDELARLRGGVELSLMRAVKAALDPRGIMNPGKIFADPSE